MKWIDAAKHQPPQNVKVIVRTPGTVDVGFWTGSDWHTALAGSEVTHWCRVEDVPAPKISPPAVNA